LQQNIDALRIGRFAGKEFAMLKRICAVSAAVAGALLIATGAQAMSSGQLVCDRPLSSASPVTCEWFSAGAAPERIAVVTSAGEPVRSRSSQRAADVVVVSQPTEGILVTRPGSGIYVLEPVSSNARGEHVAVLDRSSVVVIREPRRDDGPIPYREDGAKARHSSPE
jgi:hypothetical protein